MEDEKKRANARGSISISTKNNFSELSYSNLENVDSLMLPQNFFLYKMYGHKNKFINVRNYVCLICYFIF